MIIVIAHIKGGTGKTTVATQLALQRQITQPERKVWLIDADEQKSAADTVSVRTSLSLAPGLFCSACSNSKQLVSQLNSQGKHWDDILIDCGGRDTNSMRVALLAADKLIVPVLPRAYDIWALDQLSDIVILSYKHGGKFQCFTLVNRRDKSAESRDALALLQQNTTFTLLSTSLSDRMAYAKACGTARAVSEMRPRDKTAVAEMEALAAEVFED